LSLSIKLGDAGHARRHKLLAMLVLSFALTAGSIICATPIFAQNIVSGPTSLPGLDASGSTAASDGAATTVQPSSQLTPGEANQAPLNAELLAQPTYGTAPLTVDFAVIIASSAGSLTYQWNFGDGAVSSLPFAAYFPHVYQRPGTYWCYLTLTGAGGRSATVFTPVIVLPRQS
jgi:PKD repeat protein